MVKRIFDIVAKRATEEPEAVMLAAKEQGKWNTYNCGQVYRMAQKICGGLQSLGLKGRSNTPEDAPKIAIVSPNRPEWIITDVGVQMAGAVLTPIYPTVSTSDMTYILNDADVHVIFVADAELYERFKESFHQVSGLKNIYSFDNVPGLSSWTELMSKDLQPDEAIMQSISEESLATIIYTSGTTGNPKGVMLSHKNIVSNVRDSMPVFHFAERGGRALSFLPLNHIFERMVSYVYIHAGVSIYYAESMDTIGDNLREVKPMVFTTVPRLLEKVYEKILGKGMELTGIKKTLFFWALDLATKYDNASPGSLWYRMQLGIADKLIFSKWREALGGEVKAIVTGSAACQERLIRIFTAAGIVIMEGYGLTETSPVVSVNRFEAEGRRVGTIGPLIDNVQVKIDSDGEILVKGPNVMMGYYKRPDLTGEAVTGDGWFHTGDIGEWIDNRFLKITDRKKEIFKTSGGKYVAPQVIENKMKESLYIEQLIVIGAGRKFVSALIVPAFDHIRKNLKERGYPTPADNAELIKVPEAKELVQHQLDKFNPLFSHPEQIKKFELLPNEWTIDTGELTPSIKIKRKFIEQRYAMEIEAMYT